ncbi:Mov34/MPN/PAD-1 family protein [Amphibacillus sp. MSJ-3]|uniref:Mov34/MPN/PAD-1 family protein n=1 Tax=Amphibacillus sp. MSJ-3 TaxID=2841505 RepID=UPI001C0F1CD0|nr:Mov34/MPN/PAD-1 family protein [Amphibacillus sp. MSJ-3]MBU5593841.1 Mov34/MPN/PAD-1 family protein [Amphibacillus sp. MSJ-3]
MKKFSNEVLSIEVRDGVVNQLSHFIQREAKSLESGGILMGKRLYSGDIIITDITTPQKGDIRKRMYFKKKTKIHQKISDDIWAESKGRITYVGEWHTHPENIPTPSFVDIKGWELGVKKQKNNKVYLFLIIGIREFGMWSYDEEHGLIQMERIL